MYKFSDDYRRAGEEGKRGIIQFMRRILHDPSDPNAFDELKRALDNDGIGNHSEIKKWATGVIKKYRDLQPVSHIIAAVEIKNAPQDDLQQEIATLRADLVRINEELVEERVKVVAKTETVEKLCATLKSASTILNGAECKRSESAT